MALGLSGSGLITGFDPTASGFGKVLQVVRATDVTERNTTSVSFVDVTGLSVTITPTKTTSLIMLIQTAYVGSSAGTNAYIETQITTNANVVVSGAEKAGLGLGSSTANFTQLTQIGYHSPATTSAVTYKARFRAATATTASYFNQIQTAQLFAIEVSA